MQPHPGKIVQVRRPGRRRGISAQRASRHLQTRPSIDGQGSALTLEVQQHLGDGLVRTIAMAATEGFKRGMKVTDTGGPISVPVGDRRRSAASST